ncbi:HlyD family type I secretion periplasmic adaptor subunit [Oecophyllibacter saccharovorans]|uniref:HlyD family type I secretion periplasmic adaptor subunit n=1 Tax=Oecophyllibacter saccharovorans TaxID=2558360 RepID=UPI00116D5688|nr:HlyD family type I secretion periplasmic adaptor subunit [Oecophyllibacter saccharovorans]TPW36239.1 HlyD family type I secretion periplasmic adaptor subunit [Oecophyllibacter saccharovorans]
MSAPNQNNETPRQPTGQSSDQRGNHLPARSSGEASPSGGVDGSQNAPREATDPFAPGGMPVELLEFHSPTTGLVNLPASATAEGIIWIVSGLVLASLAAMALFPLNKVVSVQGRLISVEQPMEIQSFESAIVRSVHAHIGEYVHKGQVLLTLDPTLSQANAVSLSDQVLSYRAEIARLKAEIQGEAYTPDLNEPASVEQGKVFVRRQQDYKAHLQDYAKRISALQNDLQTARANAAMYASKLRVVSAVLSMRQRELQAQVGSRLSTLEAQNSVMDTERSLIAAQQEAHAAQSKLDALQAVRTSYVENWKATALENLTQAERKYAQLKGDYQKARLYQGLIELRAPADGVVLTINRVTPGAVAQMGTNLMTLMPVGTGLEMEGLMSAQDGGYVKTGDHALIKFNTFPYDQFGGALGTVRLISADTFMPNQMMSDNIRAGVDPNELQGGEVKGAPLYYRVRIKITKFTLHGVPPFFHPAPGVPVTADIDVGKRTIMQYLFSQAMPTLTNGMREPS